MRSLELHFLDVGQGDAAFIITPNGTKILVDGGLRERALGFLIRNSRLDLPESDDVVIEHLFLSHTDVDHVEGPIQSFQHDRIDVRNIHHDVIAQLQTADDHETITGFVGP